MLTICVKCRHVQDDHRRTGPAWTHQCCTASPRERAIDFVTGEEGYRGSGGGMTDAPYHYARDINREGCCPLYEAREE